MTKTIGYSLNYNRAYTEVNCLLNHLPESYINKLPKELLKLIQKQSNDEYNINIDTNKSLLEQNLSKEAKDLIAVLKYNYWSTEDEREHIRKKLNENEKLFQKELTEKYSVDNLFNQREKKENNIKEEIKAVVEYKEKNIIQKIIDKIKMIFNCN